MVAIGNFKNSTLNRTLFWGWGIPRTILNKNPEHGVDQWFVLKLCFLFLLLLFIFIFMLLDLAYLLLVGVQYYSLIDICVFFWELYVISLVIEVLVFVCAVRRVQGD